MPTDHVRVRTHVAQVARRRVRHEMQAAVEMLLRLRLDTGLSQILLAAAAGISRAYLCEIESGSATPSLDVLARLSAALGAEASVRIYPGTGPLVHDHLQLAIAEAFLEIVHRAWGPRAEVPVPPPTRGSADLMLHDPARRQAVEIEIYSDLRRVEQQLRWSQAKADTLAALLPPGSRMYRLVILRSTATTRHLVARNAALFEAAFPASVAAAYAALRDPALPWPGDVLMWATVESGRARLLPTPPRGIRVGRSALPGSLAP